MSPRCRHRSVGLRVSKCVDTARSQQDHIDAVAHFKTKLNYKRSAAVYSSSVSDPRGLLSTSTHRKLHLGKSNLARSLVTCLRLSARSGRDCWSLGRSLCGGQKVEDPVSHSVR